MREWLSYERTIIERGVSDTFKQHLLQKAFGWPLLTLVAILLFYLADYIAPRLNLDPGGEMSIAVLTLIAGALVVAAHLLVNLVAAPMRIARDKRHAFSIEIEQISQHRQEATNKLKQLQQDLDVLQEQIRPKLVIQCNDKQRDDYHRLMLDVTNTGAALFGGCDVKLMSIKDGVGVELLKETNVSIINLGLRGEETKSFDISTINKGVVHHGAMIIGRIEVNNARLWLDVDFYTHNTNALKITCFYWHEGTVSGFWNLGRRVTEEEAHLFQTMTPFAVWEVIHGRKWGE